MSYQSEKQRDLAVASTAATNSNEVAPKRNRIPRCTSLPDNLKFLYSKHMSSLGGESAVAKETPGNSPLEVENTDNKGTRRRHPGFLRRSMDMLEDETAPPPTSQDRAKLAKDVPCNHRSFLKNLRDCKNGLATLSSESNVREAEEGPLDPETCIWKSTGAMNAFSEEGIRQEALTATS